MRKSLGSIFVFVLICLELSASPYKWSSLSSKKEIYTNETVYIKYTCEFVDKGELYTIVLKPKYDEAKYSFELLKKQDTLIDEKRISTYEYLVKSKNEGKLTFALEADMKETTLEFIVDSSGSRDDDRGDEESKENIILVPSPKINVLSSPSDIVGDLHLKVIKDKLEVKAYEAYHLDVEISGLGNLEDLKAIEYVIDGVKVFSQKPSLEIKKSKEGKKGTWSQKFAFVGEKDFSIPKINIKYFDLKSKSIKSLEIESSDIKVTQVYKKEELLDETEQSKLSDIFAKAMDFIYYLLTFIAGFLLAKIKFKKEKVDLKSQIFIQKVRDTQSVNELSMLLILNNERKFSPLLGEFDANSSISLAEAKRKVLKFKED